MTRRGPINRRLALCPVCEAMRPVNGSGLFAKHNRLADDGRRVPCEGAGQDAGLW